MSGYPGGSHGPSGAYTGHYSAATPTNYASTQPHMSIPQQFSHQGVSQMSNHPQTPPQHGLIKIKNFEELIDPEEIQFLGQRNPQQAHQVHSEPPRQSWPPNVNIGTVRPMSNAPRPPLPVPAPSYSGSQPSGSYPQPSNSSYMSWRDPSQSKGAQRGQQQQYNANTNVNYYPIAESKLYSPTQPTTTPSNGQQWQSYRTNANSDIRTTPSPGVGLGQAPPAFNITNNQAGIQANDAPSGTMCEFIGIVTQIDTLFGMVNKEIFFQMSCVKGEKPKLGQKVFIQAEKVVGMPFNWNGKLVRVIFDQSIENFNQQRPQQLQQQPQQPPQRPFVPRLSRPPQRAPPPPPIISSRPPAPLMSNFPYPEYPELAPDFMRRAPVPLPAPVSIPEFRRRSISPLYTRERPLGLPTRRESPPASRKRGRSRSRSPIYSRRAVQRENRSVSPPSNRNRRSSPLASKRRHVSPPPSKRRELSPPPKRPSRSRRSPSPLKTTYSRRLPSPKPREKDAVVPKKDEGKSKARETTKKKEVESPKKAQKPASSNLVKNPKAGKGPVESPKKAQKPASSNLVKNPKAGLVEEVKEKAQEKKKDDVDMFEMEADDLEWLHDEVDVEKPGEGVKPKEDKEKDRAKTNEAEVKADGDKDKAKTDQDGAKTKEGGAKVIEKTMWKPILNDKGVEEAKEVEGGAKPSEKGEKAAVKVKGCEDWDLDSAEEEEELRKAEPTKSNAKPADLKKTERSKTVGTDLSKEKKKDVEKWVQEGIKVIQVEKGRSKDKVDDKKGAKDKIEDKKGPKDAKSGRSESVDIQERKRILEAAQEIKERIKQRYSNADDLRKDIEDQKTHGRERSRSRRNSLESIKRREHHSRSRELELSRRDRREAFEAKCRRDSRDGSHHRRGSDDSRDRGYGSRDRRSREGRSRERREIEGGQEGAFIRRVSTEQIGRGLDIVINRRFDMPERRNRSPEGSYHRSRSPEGPSHRYRSPDRCGLRSISPGRHRASPGGSHEFPHHSQRSISPPISYIHRKITPDRFQRSPSPGFYRGSQDWAKSEETGYFPGQREVIEREFHVNSGPEVRRVVREGDMLTRTVHQDIQDGDRGHGGHARGTQGVEEYVYMDMSRPRSRSRSRARSPRSHRERSHGALERRRSRSRGRDPEFALKAIDLREKALRIEEAEIAVRQREAELDAEMRRIRGGGRVVAHEDHGHRRRSRSRSRSSSRVRILKVFDDDPGVSAREALRLERKQLEAKREFKKCTCCGHWGHHWSICWHLVKGEVYPDSE